MRPIKLAHHTMSILTGRKNTAFSCVNSSMAPSPKQTIFVLYLFSRLGKPHSTFDLVRNSHLRDMNIQSFDLITLFFSSYAVMRDTEASEYFCTLCKNCYKIQMCNWIAAIFGTNEEHIKMNSCTKFAA